MKLNQQIHLHSIWPGIPLLSMFTKTSKAFAVCFLIALKPEIFHNYDLKFQEIRKSELLEKNALLGVFSYTLLRLKN
nr:hypothetical protein Iba_chr04aCG16010 [Ipomoea batatas]